MPNWRALGGRSTIPVRRPRRPLPRWIVALAVAVVAGAAAGFLATDWIWNRAASFAQDDSDRPYVAGIVVAFAALAWFLLPRFSAGAKAAVTGAAALLGAAFLVVPNLAPPTIDSFEFKNFAIERNVTLADYANHYPVASLLASGRWRPFDATARQGTVVLFDSEVKGRADERIGLRWTLFDATTKRRLEESEALDPLCVYRYEQTPNCLTRTPERRDSDVASFEFWVDTSSFGDVECFFIRFEARIGGTRLSAADSPTFPRVDSAAGACEDQASAAAPRSAPTSP